VYTQKKKSDLFLTKSFDGIRKKVKSKKTPKLLAQASLFIIFELKSHVLIFIDIGT
jgi:hypothetical protein